MFTKTPDPTSAHIIELCAQINPLASPILLPIRPGKKDAPQDCFNNVRRKVSSEGGRLVLGWAIWEWPGLYIEAEHHAVYEPPETGAKWIDITPPEQINIVARVFVEDSSATYDFVNEGIRRDNKRRALVNDPLVDQLFQTARAHNEIMNSIPGVGTVAVPFSVAQELQRIATLNTDITFKLAMKYTPRSARCFCGSGKKFKRCHGQ